MECTELWSRQTERGGIGLEKELIELAKRLIAIPGYAELPEKETKTAEALYQELCAMELQAELVNYNGRFNVSCEYQGKKPGPVIVLCTHLDTVPPYEMKDPFQARIEDGKLYGRGSVDVRGILAAMSIVMKKLFTERPEICGKVRFLAVSDEESGSYGMRQALQHGYDADLTIVGEPTDLRIGAAHKGVAWLQIDFKGQAAHGSVPEEGHNAVYDGACFVNFLLRETIPNIKQHRVHPLLGTASVNVGKMDGGTRPTIVPECCRIQIDRRLVPGENAFLALEEIKAAAQKAVGKTADFKADIILGGSEQPFPPLDSTPYEAVLECVQDVLAGITGIRNPCIGLPFWTDAALPGYYTGKPALVIGPGNIAQAHSNNEYVDIRQLEQAVQVYYSLATSGRLRDILRQEESFCREGRET